MSLSDDIERLKRIPLLSVLDDEGLRLIAFNAEYKTAPDGEVVFFVGDNAPGAFLITDGVLSLLELVDAETKEHSLLRAGMIAEPYALISDLKHSYTAKAVGDLSYLVLDRVTFIKVMKNYPELAERVQEFLSDDIQRIATSLTGVAARLDYLD